MSPAPIALFVPSLRGGGAERVALNLARGLANAGVPVHVVTARAEGPFLQDLPPEVRLVDLGAGRVLTALWPLAAYLRRERPAAIISFMDHANLVALWARRASGVPTRVVATVHNSALRATGNGRRGRASFMPLLTRVFYRWADAVVCVSKGVADDLARTTGLPRDRFEVIYNPVITPELVAAAAAPPPHPWLARGEPPVVLGVGRLAAQKDFPTLVRAFALVRRQRRARLMILGEGAERLALEALVRELGMGDDVALPGFVAASHAYMAHAGVFVLSSAWEGLPTVLIEALAAGAPVVSTDCPSGPQEILRGGALGRLVPVGDPGALAEAILATLGRDPVAAPKDALEPYTLAAAVDHYLRTAGPAVGDVGGMG